MWTSLNAARNSTTHTLPHLRQPPAWTSRAHLHRSSTHIQHNRFDASSVCFITTTDKVIAPSFHCRRCCCCLCCNVLPLLPPLRHQTSKDVSYYLYHASHRLLRVCCCRQAHAQEGQQKQEPSFHSAPDPRVLQQRYCLFTTLDALTGPQVPPGALLRAGNVLLRVYGGLARAKTRGRRCFAVSINVLSHQQTGCVLGSIAVRSCYRRLQNNIAKCSSCPLSWAQIGNL